MILKMIYRGFVRKPDEYRFILPESLGGKNERQALLKKLLDKGVKCSLGYSPVGHPQIIFTSPTPTNSFEEAGKKQAAFKRLLAEASGSSEHFFVPMPNY